MTVKILIIFQYKRPAQDKILDSEQSQINSGSSELF